MSRLLVASFLIGLSLNLPALGQTKKLPVTGLADADLAGFDEMMLQFMADNQVPGAALAVAKDGRLVYARGFGHADEQKTLGVQPVGRFRIASISKPITAAMILRLIELGLLKLEDSPFDILKMSLPASSDDRLRKVTIRHLLHHTAGWDRAKSFDPMFRPIVIAKDLRTDPPAKPMDVIHYMLKQPLDFDPGTRYAYSNFGYCLLGRVIEKLTGQTYDAATKKHIFEPLSIKHTQLGKTLTPAKDEVHYFDDKKGQAVVGIELGKQVPRPYGAWYLEAMDSHGGWISTAPDLVRFGSAFDPAQKCKILKAEAIHLMFEAPAGINPNPKDADLSYACGWNVRKAGTGKNHWHNGALDGTATSLVHRHDGVTWAVLFNARTNGKGVYLAGLVDPLLHEAANKVKRWPKRDLFD